MNIYEISTYYQQLLDNIQIDPETGECLGTQELEALEQSFEERATNIVLYIKNVNAEMQAIKSEELNLQKRRKSSENKIKYLENILLDNMVKMNVNNIKNPKFDLKLKKTKQLQLDDMFVEWAIKNNDSFLRYKTPEVDKNSVKEYLKNNKLELAEIVDKQKIFIK